MTAEAIMLDQRAVCPNTAAWAVGRPHLIVLRPLDYWSTPPGRQSSSDGCLSRGGTVRPAASVQVSRSTRLKDKLRGPAHADLTFLELRVA